MLHFLRSQSTKKDANAGKVYTQMLVFKMKKVQKRTFSLAYILKGVLADSFLINMDLLWIIEGKVWEGNAAHFYRSESCPAHFIILYLQFFH